MKHAAKGKFRPKLTITLILLHLGVVAGIFWCARNGWNVNGALWWAIGLYCISSLGVTAGYHRYWTHGAFKCSRGVQYVLAVMSALAAEGTIARWRRDHRQHHAFTDLDGDPHSPWRFAQPLGFIWAHIGWLLWDTLPPAGYEPSDKQDDDPVVRWQAKWYWPLVLAGFVLPFIFCGWSGLWLAGFTRLMLHLHVTWSVNSVCHMWGTRPRGPDGKRWTLDQARNNILVAFLSMGEGWHGNHHVKQNAANLGHSWWRWDPGKWFIYTLRGLGLAWDVNVFRRLAPQSA